MNRGRLIFEPPRFMNPNTAFSQILLTESFRHANEDARETPSLCRPDQTLALSLSRIGTPSQRIIAGSISELATLSEDEFGSPLHSVVIVGRRLHPLELEYAGRWCVGGEGGDWWKIAREVYGVKRERIS
jgi:diphthine methyl ester synthase